MENLGYGKDAMTVKLVKCSPDNVRRLRMPKLVVNYMRPTAVTLFALVTVAIVISFFSIPKVYSITLSDFYCHYWHLLTELFVIATLFLVFAFYVERRWLAVHWIQHSIAILFMSLFIREGFILLRVADTFLAFAG